MGCSLFPDRVTIQERRRQRGTLGGDKTSWVTISTNVRCSVQTATLNETTEFDKRGENITHRVFFQTDPLVDEENRLLFTDSRTGVTTAFEVRSEANAAVNRLGIHKVMVEEKTGDIDRGVNGGIA